MARKHRTSWSYGLWIVAAMPILASCLVPACALGAVEARWEEVLRAAEREGEVTVYATNSVGDLPVIWEAFRKKFPKMKLNAVSSARPARSSPRLWQSAGRACSWSMWFSERPVQPTTV